MTCIRLALLSNLIRLPKLTAKTASKSDRNQGVLFKRKGKGTLLMLTPFLQEGVCGRCPEKVTLSPPACKAPGGSAPDSGAAVIRLSCRTGPATGVRLIGSRPLHPSLIRSGSPDWIWI